MKGRSKKHRALRTSILTVSCILGIAAGAAGLSSLQNQRSFPETVSHYLDLLSGREEEDTVTVSRDLSDLPSWDGTRASVEVNHNIPSFSEEDMDIPEGMVYYSSLDAWGRCGSVTASVCRQILPEEERDDAEERMQVLPSGYAQTTYPEELVEHGFLYNRCHLLAWQLGGDASSLNLFAGTRFLNTEGMLPYENRVAAYIRRHPDQHVVYRVTPVFMGEEQNCRGVVMEACAQENPEDFHFCVFIYNEQPGIVINHWDGSSYREEETVNDNPNSIPA